MAAVRLIAYLVGRSTVPPSDVLTVQWIDLAHRARLSWVYQIDGGLKRSCLNLRSNESPPPIVPPAPSGDRREWVFSGAHNSYDPSGPATHAVQTCLISTLGALEARLDVVRLSKTPGPHGAGDAGDLRAADENARVSPGVVPAPCATARHPTVRWHTRLDRLIPRERRS